MLVYPKIDPILFSIGPLHFRWYGLMYVLGILLGFSLIKKPLLKKIPLNNDQFVSLIMWIAFGIIIGGRVGYILFYDFFHYLKHPFEIIAYWHGGMSYHGGALGCVIALYFFAKKNTISWVIMLDFLGVGSTIGVFLGRIGNFINGELLGRVTQVPWAIVLPHAPEIGRHPSQLYEAFFEGFLLFCILFWILKRNRYKDGQLFAYYLVLYGLFRFVIEFFREPDVQLGTLFGPFTMGQFLCTLMIIGGCLWYYKKTS